MNRGLLCFFLILCPILVGASLATAAPSLNGSRGLLRVLSAEEERGGILGLGYHIEYGRLDSLNRGYDGWMSLGYSAFDFLDVSVGLPHTYWSSKSGDDWVEGPPDGTGDMTIGLRGSYEFTHNAMGGLFAYYNAPTLGALGDAEMKPSDTLQHHGGFGATALFTYAQYPFKAHANVGLTRNIDKYEHDGDSSSTFYPNISAPFGIGMEYTAGNFTPFIEAYMYLTIDSTTYGHVDDPEDRRTRSIMENPLWITPGVRYKTDFGLGVDFALDFNIAGDAPDYGIMKQNPSWMILGGVTYAWRASPAGGGEAVCVTGIVKDEQTKDPLSATVILADVMMKTNPATGTFECSPKGPGTYEVQASSKGYIAQTKQVTLTKYMVNRRMPLLVSFYLKKSGVSMGSLTGTVTDFDTWTPLAASVTFKEPNTPAGMSDVVLGRYEFDMEKGNYNMVVVSEGYLTHAVSAFINEGKETVIDVRLHSKKRKLVLRGIQFETASARIRSESRPVLDEAVSILRENPTIRVEVGGHTDDRGSATYNYNLSQSRASSVRNYIVAAGISPGRMTTRGYGEDVPIESNASVDGRTLNRRIEFTIIAD